MWISEGGIGRIEGIHQPEFMEFAKSALTSTYFAGG